MKLQLPLDFYHPLVIWADSVAHYFNKPVYLVGSQITGSQNPRDVDVIVVIPDVEFETMFGGVAKWIQEGDTGEYTDIRYMWIAECNKHWKCGIFMTKFLLDFKIIPESYHATYKHIHDKYPPYKLDTL